MIYLIVLGGVVIASMAAGDAVDRNRARADRYAARRGAEVLEIPPP
jgi:nitrous oxide reductase accessory protein NosL